MNVNIFSKVFLKLREEAGLKQDEIAKKLGVSKSTVGMWEIGKRLPSPELYEAIADCFNVDIDYLYGRTSIRQKVHYDNDGTAYVPATLLISDREKDHILTYRDLSDQGKDRVDEYTERTRDLEKQDEDSKIVESFQNRFVARNGNKNLTPDQMKAIMDILDGGNKDV